jgi:FAD binding domain/Berberine and berberine like
MADRGTKTATLPELPGFDGARIAPGDAEYDEARTVFPGGIDRRPAAIFRPADAEEVARVIGLARETGLELAVRGGGHSGAGHGVCDGGIVLDLAGLDDLEIDPESRTAWAGGGLTTGQYTAAAWEHRLATGFGDAGTVGIGGITLSGGVGFFVRKYGMTIDSLLAAEVVTAAGEVIVADAEDHSELLWALRGGGGNFGVVTRLKLRLHEVPEFYGGELIIPATPETVAGFVSGAEAAPEELSVIVNVMPAPPMPFIPEERHGELVVRATIAFAGPADEGERAVAPFRELAEPVADMVGPCGYPELFQDLPDDYHPVADLRTFFADEYGPAEAERTVAGLNDRPSAMGVVQIRVLGGEMARVPATDTAFAHRDRRLMVNVAAMYMPGEEPGSAMEWIEELGSSLKGRDGAYAGFLFDEGIDRVREAYPGSTWDRLAEVKRRYDPENVFRLNQNVPPGTK